MPRYIRELRSHIGHAPLIVNAAAAIIQDSERRILLQLRAGSSESDDWSLPGGIMEIGEYAHEAAIREAKEETGLDIVLTGFVGVYSTPEMVRYPNGDACHMITQVFSADVAGGALSADGEETRRLEFFPIEARPVLFRVHLERALADFLAGRHGISD